MAKNLQTTDPYAIGFAGTRQVVPGQVFGPSPDPVAPAPSSGFFFTDHPKVGVAVPARERGQSNSILTMPVANQQAFLRHQGYAVTVDGIAGPQTKTALKAFLHGTPAATWNHAWNADVAVRPHTAAQHSAYGTSGDGTAPTPRSADAGQQPNGLAQIAGQIMSQLGAYKPLSASEQLALARQQATIASAPQVAANRGAREQAQLQYQQALALANSQSQRAQAQAAAQSQRRRRRRSLTRRGRANRRATSLRPSRTC